MTPWRLLLLWIAVCAITCAAQSADLGAGALASEDCEPEGIPASVRLHVMHDDRFSNIFHHLRSRMNFSPGWSRPKIMRSAYSPQQTPFRVHRQGAHRHQQEAC
jgi:hypothetical protein